MNYVAKLGNIPRAAQKPRVRKGQAPKNRGSPITPLFQHGKGFGMRKIRFLAMGIGLVMGWVIGIWLAEPTKAGEPTFVGILAFLDEPEVAKQLELSADQQQKLTALIESREAEALELALQLRNLSPGERAERLRPFRRESERRGLALLTPQQQKKLQQIRLQKMGLASLAEEDVAASLGLTEQQKAEVAKILREREDRLAVTSKDRAHIVRAETERQLAQLLTPEQKIRWERVLTSGEVNIPSASEPSLPAEAKSPASASGEAKGASMGEKGPSAAALAGSESPPAEQNAKAELRASKPQLPKPESEPAKPGSEPPKGVLEPAKGESEAALPESAGEKAEPTPQPNQPPPPAEATQPEGVPKPAQPSKSEAVPPAEQPSSPTEGPKPTELPKSPELLKPTELPKSSELSKSPGLPKPEGVSQPSEPAKPTEFSSPVQQPKLAMPGQAPPPPQEPMPGEVPTPEPLPAEPGQQASAPQVPLDQVKLRFNFRYQPWKDVLEWFAQQAGLSLIMDDPPKGTFNYIDDKAYTPAEAIDLLNSVLQTKGYVLVRRNRMLMVINLENGIPPLLIDTIPVEELDRRGTYEVVSVLFQLQKLTPEEIEGEVQKMLGPMGSVVSLPKSRQLLVTETVGRLRAIRRAIERAEDPEGIHRQQQLRQVALQYASPQDVLPVLRQFLDIPAEQAAAPDGSIRVIPDPTGKGLLVSGNEEKIHRLMEVLKFLDVPENAAKSQLEETPQLEVYSVAPADPNSVLAVIQTLLAGSPDARVAIDPKTGNLIALCKPSEHATIRATLEQMQADPRKIEVIPLSRVDPQAAATSIKKLFGIGETPDPNKPQIEVDTTAKQLLVRATQTQLEQIKLLLEKMGESGEAVAEPTTRGNVRMVPLTGRTAQEALERALEIWPTMYRNRIRVVRPSAVIPTMQPSSQESSRASEGTSSWESGAGARPAETPEGLLEELFGPFGLPEPGPSSGGGLRTRIIRPPAGSGAPGGPPSGAAGSAAKPTAPSMPSNPLPKPPPHPPAGQGTPRAPSEAPSGANPSSTQKTAKFLPGVPSKPRALMLLASYSAPAEAGGGASAGASSPPAGSPSAAPSEAPPPGENPRDENSPREKPPAENFSKAPLPAEKLAPETAPAERPIAEKAAVEQTGPKASAPPAGGAPAPANPASKAAHSGAPPEQKESAGPESQKTAEEPPIIVVAPGPGGIMIASEDLDALDAFENLLNSIASNLPESNVTVFYLKHAKAEAVADLLERIFGGSSSSEAGSTMGGGRGLLGDIAGAALGDAGGGILGALLGLGGPGGPGPSSFTPTGTIQITPDPRLNALIVQANAKDTEMIEELLKILDQEKGPEPVAVQPKARVIPVFNTSAEDIAELLREVYSDRLIGGGRSQRLPTPQEFIQMLRGGGSRRGAGASSQVDIQQKMAIGVDSRNNAIIVVAPDQLFEEVEQLVKQLDAAAAESSQVIRVVNLRNANPTAVQQALSALMGSNVQFGRAGTPSRSRQPQQPVQPGTQPPDRQFQAPFMMPGTPGFPGFGQFRQFRGEFGTQGAFPFQGGSSARQGRSSRSGR